MHNFSMKKMSNTGGGHGVNASDGAEEESRIESIRGKVNQFAARNGRRPRVLVSQVGTSGQRRALNRVAAIFARSGFDVDIGPICQSPQQAALMAIENDVHMVCLLGDTDQSAQMGNELMDALKAHDSDDILVTFFCDTNTGGYRHQNQGGRYGPVGIRLSTADADIISILDKLS
jgi:methylmalonyl-CoA mutase